MSFSVSRGNTQRPEIGKGDQFMNDSLRDYLDHQVSESDPGKLVVMLYERALSDLEQAKELFSSNQASLTPKQEDQIVRLLVHAQTIVSELSRSLDLQRGGEIAKKLWQLYEYVQFVINQSVIKRGDEGLEPACKVMLDLLEAWKQITGQNPPGQTAPYPAAGLSPETPASPTSNPVHGYDIQSGTLKAILVA